MKKSLRLLATFILGISTILAVQSQDVVIDNIITDSTTCSDGSDGTLTFDISGGTPRYIYTVLTSGFLTVVKDTAYSDTTIIVENLNRGSYFILVTDQDAGNENGNTSVLLPGPGPVVVSFDYSTDVLCRDDTNGSLKVVATGESKTYDYVLSGPVTGSNDHGEFLGLPGGNYTVTATDDGGCNTSDISEVITIVNPDEVSAINVVITPAGCYGTATGAIDITPDGGVPATSSPEYIFAWTGPDDYSSTDEDISGLSAGNYFVTITDGNSCSTLNGPYTVGQSTEITVNVTDSTDVRCNLGSDGSVTISVSGGAGGYTYIWAGDINGLVSTLPNPVNLPADTYTLFVTDAVGCTQDFPDIVSIEEPDALSIVPGLLTDITCNGGSDGAAEITGVGGTPAYNFEWTGKHSGFSSFDQNPTLMPADTFSVRINDSESCTELFDDLVVLTEPEPVVVVVDSTKDAECKGDSNGNAWISVSGGNGSYTFYWEGIVSGHTSTMENPDDLPADTYNLRVTDGIVCNTDFPGLLIIGEPVVLGLNVDDVTDVACFGESTGSIDISPTGGTAPFSYAWTSPDGYTSTEQNIINLLPGDYNVVVTDAHSCSYSYPTPITVGENLAITATYTIIDLSCGEPVPSNNGSIVAVAAGGAGTYTYAWEGPDSYTGSGATITNLVPGSYVLEVSDLLGCIQPMTAVVVGQPDEFIAYVSDSSDIDCNGNGNGSIDLFAGGGTGPYTYDWTGPGGLTWTSKDLTNLEAGEYFVEVSDSEGCLLPQFLAATIEEPDPITTSSTKNDVSCNGADDGSISVSVSGGIGPYDLTWGSPGGFTGNTEIITGLAPDDYNLRVIDANSCEENFEPQESITEPAALSISYVSQSNLKCHGDANGSIVVSVSGGIAPYTYYWTNASNDTVSNMDIPVDLIAGSYSVAIEDVAGCSAHYLNIQLTQPDELITTLTKTEITCFAEGDGIIVASTTGGTGFYLYSSDGTNFQGSNSFPNLGPGLYTIITRDVNLCEDSDDITINEPTEIIIGQESAEYLCHGDLKGEIIISDVSGGSGSYEYSIDGGLSYQADSTFSNLAPGSYQTTILDNTGCPLNGQLNELIEPDELIIDDYDQFDITTCFYDETGIIDIEGAGGTGDLSYSINGAAPVASGLFENLARGSYELSITDENGCPEDTTVEILSPPELVFDEILSTNIPGCYGDETGTITATGLDGTGSLEYSLDNITYQDNGSFIELPADDYTVWLQDANGCTISSDLSITQPDSISATITKTDLVFGELGSISISDVSGGTSPYEYSIGGSFSGTMDYPDLPAGIYEVVVRDDNTCTKVENVQILDILPLNVSLEIEDITCHGLNNGSILFSPQDAEGDVTYSIDNGLTFGSESLFENLTPGDYNLVAIDDAGKLFTATVSIIEPAELLISPSVDDAECNAFSETGSIVLTISGGTGAYTTLWSDGITDVNRPAIGAGTYQVFVMDENDCEANEVIIVGSSITVTANAGADQTICPGESTELEGSGNGTAEWDDSPYLSDLNSMNPTAGPLPEASYFILTITENSSSQCFNKDTVLIDVYPETGLDVTPDTFIVRGSNIELEASGGPFQSYRWEPETGLDNPLSPTPVAAPQDPIQYFVYALNEYGCEESDSVFIDVIENIRAYNVFSPNDDEYNPYFEIKNAERFPEMVVKIYGRWGDLLYSTVGYSDEKRWDGTARGKKVPVGTYYYIIVPYSGAKPISGTVTIIY